MFDSLLNSKFYNKCKHAIKCIRTRLDPIRRKKQAMLRFLKKDIADLLANGLDQHAFGRMEALIVEMNQATCYDMIEQFCEYIVKQLHGLQKQRDCPQEALQAVSTLIFAAARFPDLPELCDLRHLFTERYGSNIDSFVSSEFVGRLQNKSFSNEEKVQVMQNIAEEFSVRFDARAFAWKLSGAPEAKHDLPKKGSFKTEEPSVPKLDGHKEDTRSKRKYKPSPVGIVQKQELQLEPKDIHVIPDGNGQLHERTRKQYADRPDNLEPSYNFVLPSDMKQRNCHKEIKKDDQKDCYPCRKVPMDEEETDLNGQGKQEVGTLKSPEGKINKMVVPPYSKPRGGGNKEDHVEKENGNAFGRYNKSRMVGGVDYDGQKEDKIELEKLGLQKRGIGSANSLNGKTANKLPPYTKLNGKWNEQSAQEETDNAFLYGKSPHVDLGPSEQDCRAVRPVNHERAVNMIPPYVKPKFNTRSAYDNPANQTATSQDKHNGAEGTDPGKDGLGGDEPPRPISVRRKCSKPPPPVDAYDEALDGEKIASRTPNGRRRHTGRRSTVAYDDEYHLKGGYVQLQPGNGIDDDVKKGKNVHRTSSGRRKHTSRRCGTTYDDDYGGKVDEHQEEDDEMDSAIDFGNLLPRTPSGRRRHRSRNVDMHNGGHDEEERMMDKLLRHYSRKGFANEQTKTGTRSRPLQADHVVNGDGAVAQHGDSRSRSHHGDLVHPPGRAVSLPTDSVCPENELKVPARSTSMEPDMYGPSGGRVHPRMPDYEELAARISALRKA